MNITHEGVNYVPGTNSESLDTQGFEKSENPIKEDFYLNYLLEEFIEETEKQDDVTEIETSFGYKFVKFLYDRGYRIIK